MSKLAKAAIICTVIFLTFSIASVVLFVMAAPEIPRYAEEINIEVERWREYVRENFPSWRGRAYGDDGYVEFYFGDGHYGFWSDDRDWPDRGKHHAAPETPGVPAEPETPAEPDKPDESVLTPPVPGTPDRGRNQNRGYEYRGAGT